SGYRVRAASQTAATGKQVKPRANPIGSGRSTVREVKANQPSPTRVRSLTNSTPIARRGRRRTSGPSPNVKSRSDRPITPPPTNTPPGRGCPRSADVPTLTPTSTQCRPCSRLRLAAEVTTIEASHELDEPREAADDRQERHGHHAVGVRPQPVVDHPSDHHAGRDGARELEGHGPVAGIADDGSGGWQSSVRQDLPSGAAEPLDVSLGMGQREKHRLELRGREIHSLGEHAAEEACEARGVGTPGAGIVPNLIDPEEESQERAHAVDAGGNSGRGDRVSQLRLREGAQRIEAGRRLPPLATPPPP